MILNLELIRDRSSIRIQQKYRFLETQKKCSLLRKRKERTEKHFLIYGKMEYHFQRSGFRQNLYFIANLLFNYQINGIT